MLAKGKWFFKVFEVFSRFFVGLCAILFTILFTILFARLFSELFAGKQLQCLLMKSFIRSRNYSAG